jgi:LmbE family N-acetylglucosaminyl deacetylase
MKVLKVNKLFWGGLEDTKISEGIQTINTIEAVIGRTKPDIIFTHSEKDGHQDHRSASLASLSAARNMKVLFSYESPAALREFCPQVFFDVESTFDLKLRALEAHHSQSTKPYFNGNATAEGSGRRKRPYVSKAAEGLAKFRGFQAGIDLAEAFEVRKFLFEI